MEYVLVHRGGRGQSFVYELLWNGDVGLPAAQGEGVIVGNIDTGINWDHPSFDDSPVDGYDYVNPYDSYIGLCDDPEVDCNDKLVGVYDFVEDDPSTEDELMQLAGELSLPLTRVGTIEARGAPSGENSIESMSRGSPLLHAANAGDAASPFSFMASWRRSGSGKSVSSCMTPSLRNGGCITFSIRASMLSSSPAPRMRPEW